MSVELATSNSTTKKQFIEFMLDMFAEVEVELAPSNTTKEVPQADGEDSDEEY